MSAVELKGGLFVDEQAIALAIALEGAGHVLSVQDGKLLVTNGSALSAAQRQQITAWKRHLCAIAAYEPPQETVQVG
jgi:hypothetical protein